MQSIPSIFGSISLKGNQEEKSFPGCRKIFSSAAASLFISGDSPFINYSLKEDKIIAVIGNIYSPYNFLANKEDTFNKLTGTDICSFDGNFVVIEISINGLKIFNDKFGSRLFLYYLYKDHLYFSSNLYGLKILLNNNLSGIDENSLIHFYHFGFTNSSSTLLKGIKKLPAGHLLTVENKEVKVEQYFDLLDYYNKDLLNGLNEQEIAVKINQIMDSAVGKRAESDDVVPVTISGGVDSGFILKKLIEKGKKIAGYNLAYGTYYNEHDRIDRLSKDFNLEIKKIAADENDLIRSLEESNAISSEPVRFNDAAMRLLAMEAKKDGYNSLWDGDGADRLYFGMNRQLKYYRLFNLLKQIEKFYLLKPLSFLTSFSSSKETKKLKLIIKNYLIGIPPYPERKLLNFYNEEIEKNIFDSSVKKYLEKYNLKNPSFNLVDYFTYQSILMCPEMFFYPPYELQSALSMNPVSPYWDKDMVHTALNIPFDLKVKNGYTKYILRKAASINTKDDYWMQPKIGLQSSYKFVVNTKTGREWRIDNLFNINKTAEYEIISGHLKSSQVDIDRLLPVIIWKKFNKFF